MGQPISPKVHQIQQPELCFIRLFGVFHPPRPFAGALVTSRVVHMHEEHVLVSVQDGVELRGRRGREQMRVVMSRHLEWTVEPRDGIDGVIAAADLV